MIRSGYSVRYLRFTQIVVGLAGVGYLLAGIALLFAPMWFFQTIGHFPPFNQHYEGDLGSFLLALGIGLLVIIRNPARHLWVIRVAALGSVLHVINHIYNAVVNTAPISKWLLEIGPLLILALLLLIVSIRVPTRDVKSLPSVS